MEQMARSRVDEHMADKESIDYGPKVKQYREWIDSGGFPVAGSFANQFRSVHKHDEVRKAKYDEAKAAGRKEAELYRVELDSCTRGVVCA